jgi:hypothetical protein
MKIGARQSQGSGAGAETVRPLRPDHPEDFGRGPWWRLAELLVLGVDLRSPPPLTQWLDDEDEYAA